MLSSDLARCPYIIKTRRGGCPKVTVEEEDEEEVVMVMGEELHVKDLRMQGSGV